MRVFIVEDEHLLIKYIRNTIDWEALGMEVVGEARDGETALEQIPLVQPHIVLMDINIPIKNGIETSKEIRERYPYTKIIILTGYGEFQYAKEAIKLGVFRYLLKPIDMEELRDALECAKREIQNEIAIMEYVQKAEYSAYSAAKAEFLNRLLTGEKLPADERETRRSLEKFHIPLLPEPLIVTLISIDHLKKRFPEKREWGLRTFVVQNVVQEIVGGSAPSAVFHGPDDLVAVISNAASAREVVAREEPIRSFLKRHFDITVTMAVGSVRRGYANICRSYQDALRAIKRRFTLGLNQTILSDELSAEEERFGPADPFFDEKRKQEWLMDLRLGQFGRLEGKIRSFFGELKRCHVTKDAALFHLIEVVGLVLAFCREQNFSASALMPDAEEFMDSLRLQETIGEMEEQVIHLYRQAANLCLENRQSPTARIAERAREYICQNYANPDLSLTETAERLYVSPYYLTKVLKKELNMSFSECVNEQRMVAAKQLMDEHPSVPLSQIAEWVGFRDPYYFSKCFKKRYGITPTRYMERKRT